ncbi:MULTISPECIES: hypothetical protein [Flectobacillus]|jgi:3D (Asp-Asp-Asp) domain-containing protein|uniref:Phage protein n=1 Tax=Flectobacillus roseus TaxID=502259 RepID=A0ABT6Y297_9BACT|nr:MULTISPECIES: hypothetical protein [Flectobacillus]MDI9857687.1 hypothetical protein [Flectobacillus roseus]MDI9869590.1 hypothetical protein [Flectobacillus roseus]NBA77002.1 hypothetical protein [Emticicia sp. ODNR4P]PAC31241.1 hypothetical protein BWI92_11065 [Flectobacillus sp. BAB-3569]
MIEDYQAISNAPNSPDLNGKYLGIISTDFALVAEFVKEASYQIRTRGFSKYPIFAVSRTVVPVGSKLIGINEMNGNTWNYNATVAEEFMQRGIISAENAEVFESSYKDPDEFCCLFVFDNDFASFVYIPYPED